MKKSMQGLKTKTAKEKIDYLQTKATQPEVLRAKPRKGKRKESKGEIKQIMKKATKSTSKVSPQAFGKAFSRAKYHLPKSPERKVLVLAKMVENLSPRKRKAVVDLCDSNLKQRKEQEKDRKKRCDAFTGEVKMVQKFYARDDISRMLPGKKDYVSVEQADAKREHRQKGVLLLKIGEAHKLFKEESSVKIGKSKFAEL